MDKTRLGRDALARVWVSDKELGVRRSRFTAEYQFVMGTFLQRTGRAAYQVQKRLFGYPPLVKGPGVYALPEPCKSPICR